MGHRASVMQGIGGPEQRRARHRHRALCTILELEIRLHACASFQEKLHQLVGK
jgi:hypothetical protein